MKKLLLIALVLCLVLPTIVAISCASSAATSTMTIGEVDTFVFAKQPAGAVAGKRFATQPVVDVVDPNGKLDKSYNGPVDIVIAWNLNPYGATLAGTTTVNATAGVATFFDLSINFAGKGYALVASHGILAPTLSDEFNVTQS